LSKSAGNSFVDPENDTDSSKRFKSKDRINQIRNLNRITQTPKNNPNSEHRKDQITKLNIKYSFEEEN